MATTFIIIEDGDLDYWWECQNCGHWYKDNAKTMRMRECDACGEKIEAFLGLDEQEDL